MSFKIIGSLLIIASCGFLGFQISSAHRKSAKMMQQLISSINYMEQELRYRMSSLPEIYSLTAVYCGGAIGNFFLALKKEVERQVAPDMSYCIDAALLQAAALPELVQNGIKLLKKSLGHFDLEGQLKGLKAVQAECTTMLKDFTKNQDIRLRSYQTLALCAGAAVTIILI